LRGLRKTYGGQHAVYAIDLSVRRGEFLTLLGASGSGKSTILMMIAGFTDPSAGDILLREHSILRLPAHRRGVGIVFQSYALFPHLTVFENIAYGVRKQARKKDELASRVSDMLRLVKLEAFAGRYPDQLSGGQQQRVSVARALAPGPEILLLDEPLGALDKSLREHMLIELRHIHRSLGTTMIFVTHDQREAMAMSDRIAILNAGRIAALGTPRKLYAEPETAFVAGFLGEANILQVRTDDDRVVAGADGTRLASAPPRTSAILLRPEHARFGDLPEISLLFSGRVRETLFLGDRIKYEIITPGGERLLAYADAGLDGPRLTAEGEVRLGWRAADIRYLQEDIA